MAEIIFGGWIIEKIYPDIYIIKMMGFGGLVEPLVVICYMNIRFVQLR